MTTKTVCSLSLATLLGLLLPSSSQAWIRIGIGIPVGPYPYYGPYYRPYYYPYPPVVVQPAPIVAQPAPAPAPGYVPAGPTYQPVPSPPPQPAVAPPPTPVGR
jgi:hypothetical protein